MEEQTTLQEPRGDDYALASYLELLSGTHAAERIKALVVSYTQQKIMRGKVLPNLCEKVQAQPGTPWNPMRYDNLINEWSERNWNYGVATFVLSTAKWMGSYSICWDDGHIFNGVDRHNRNLIRPHHFERQWILRFHTFCAGSNWQDVFTLAKHLYFRRETIYLNKT